MQAEVDLIIESAPNDLSELECRELLGGIYKKNPDSFVPLTNQLYGLQQSFTLLTGIAETEAQKHRALLEKKGFSCKIDAGLSLVPVDNIAAPAVKTAGDVSEEPGDNSAENTKSAGATESHETAGAASEAIPAEVYVCQCPACEQPSTDAAICSACGVAIAKVRKLKKQEEKIQKTLHLAEQSFEDKKKRLAEQAAKDESATTQEPEADSEESEKEALSDEDKQRIKSALAASQPEDVFNAHYEQPEAASAKKFVIPGAAAMLLAAAAAWYGGVFTGHSNDAGDPSEIAAADTDTVTDTAQTTADGDTPPTGQSGADDASAAEPPAAADSDAAGMEGAAEQVTDTPTDTAAGTTDSTAVTGTNVAGTIEQGAAAPGQPRTDEELLAELTANAQHNKKITGGLAGAGAVPGSVPGTASGAAVAHTNAEAPFQSSAQTQELASSEPGAANGKPAVAQALPPISLQSAATKLNSATITDTAVLANAYTGADNLMKPTGNKGTEDAAYNAIWFLTFSTTQADDFYLQWQQRLSAAERHRRLVADLYTAGYTGAVDNAISSTQDPWVKAASVHQRAQLELQAPDDYEGMDRMMTLFLDLMMLKDQTDKVLALADHAATYRIAGATESTRNTIDQSISMVDTLSDKKSIVLALAAIAQQQALMEEQVQSTRTYERAHNTARSMTGVDADHALQIICLSQATAGRTEAAIKTAYMIGDKTLQAATGYRLVEVFNAQQDPAAATEALKIIGNSGIKTDDPRLKALLNRKHTDQVSTTMIE